jgi:hypothetical protein
MCNVTMTKLWDATETSKRRLEWRQAFFNLGQNDTYISPWINVMIFSLKIFSTFL